MRRRNSCDPDAAKRAAFDGCSRMNHKAAISEVQGSLRRPTLGRIDGRNQPASVGPTAAGLSRPRRAYGPPMKSGPETVADIRPIPSDDEIWAAVVHQAESTLDSGLRLRPSSRSGTAMLSSVRATWRCAPG